MTTPLDQRQLDAIRERAGAASDETVLCPLCGDYGSVDTPHCHTNGCKYEWHTIPTVAHLHTVRYGNGLWHDSIQMLQDDQTKLEQVIKELGHARADIPALLTEVERLSGHHKKALARLHLAQAERDNSGQLEHIKAAIACLTSQQRRGGTN